MEEQPKELPPFKFKAYAKDIRYVDCWQYGTRNGLFSLSLGLVSDPENNEGEIIFSCVMTPDSAKRLYNDLGKLLGGQNPPPASRIPKD